MPMRLGTGMPSLDGATKWLNGEGAPTIEPGKVTFIHFWAVSCHICHETMDDVVAMKTKYEDQGLQTIAIHMPRMEEDVNEDKVRADIEKYNIRQSVGLDHRMEVAEAFDNQYVPAFFIFGTDGRLKFRAAGDKGFEKVEGKIRDALGLAAE